MTGEQAAQIAQLAGARHRARFGGDVQLATRGAVFRVA
jgi:hypothetical protein